jgi:RimJ/RimL family protein N-acetyltransferase
MTFDLAAPLILENSRAELRPLTENDYGPFFSFSSSEPQLWDFSLISASGSENLKKYIQKAMLEKKEKHAYPFLVYDKLTKQVAGSTRFYNIDFHHQTLNIGYTWYGKKFQQTGLNRNCKLLLLSHAFEVWNMERVEFRADAKNSKSIAAMLAIGCTHEGTLRNNCRSISTRRDSVVLSILKSEWEGDIKKQLEGKIY